MARAFSWVVLAYIVAGSVAGMVVLQAGPLLLSGSHGEVAIAAAADFAATVAIFGFSLAFRNSSFYDPYWSIAPPILFGYWVYAAGSPGIYLAGSPGIYLAGSPGGDLLRRSACFTLVAIWALRLTYNWARGWRGLSHEDWRYIDLKEKTGPLYWLVSFVGIHMMPTVLVFLGCLPIYTVVSAASRPFGALDAVAIVVTGTAIALEAAADEQLRAFVTTRRSSSDLLTGGLWALSRHPNYFGEICFWWGIFLFGLAADPTSWWTGIGALSITILFRFVSLPMIETRMLANKPAYAAQVERTNLLVPWFPRS